MLTIHRNDIRIIATLAFLEEHLTDDPLGRTASHKTEEDSFQEASYALSIMKANTCVSHKRSVHNQRHIPRLRRKARLCARQCSVRSVFDDSNSVEHPQ